MIPEVGQRFGPYEILGRLGGGGMGLVFRAWDERLLREVAIKLLHDDYTMPGMRERFLQEARAASALNHPNICTVFDIGEQDHNPYLVMELLEGETVKDRISQRALSAEEIVRYAIEVSDALCAAHAKGIVHRDIKPANIFLVTMPNGKSQAKVLDFGLAKIEPEMRGGRESEMLDLTLAGSTVGTLAYMSPEQARGESLDLRSDLFSLGIVMYEMATRQVPFRGATSALMFVQLFSHQPEPIRNWNESIPRDLEKVILKLLAKERKARFQTAQEVHDALTKVGSKMGRGGWLGKSAGTVVPLVRASDPVAWHKGSRRKTERMHRAELLPESGGTASSSGGMSVRSSRLRGTDRDSGGRQLTHRERGSAVAVESGPMPAEALNISAAIGQGDFDVVRAAHSAEEDAVTPSAMRWSESGLERSRVAVAQLQYHFDEFSPELKADFAVAEEVAEPELIAASLKVEARTKVRILIAAVLILIGVTLTALMRSGLLRPLVLGTNDGLLLTVIQNKTGDSALSGTVMEGIEIALRQSRSLKVLGGEVYRAGLRQIKTESGESAAVSEQKVAQRVGAKAYLYGEIRGLGAPYTLSVEVLKTDSNDKLITLEETAASREEIPAAIGRIAQEIRAEVSEDSKEEVESSVPFNVDATTNLNALHAFAVGEAAMHNGRTEDAVAAYREAATFDPKFVQAEMRLAWLYREEMAEVASANAAELALGAAANASEKVKLLARFCYEMNSTGNYRKATETIREFWSRYPLDVEGVKGLAVALRVQGLLPEAWQAAQRGLGEHPFDAEMYAEAELALIGINRYGDAMQLEAKAERVGVGPSGYALTAAYLDGREDVVAARIRAMQDAGVAGGTKVRFGELYRYGVYLDNAGKLDAGFELWRIAAAWAGKIPELVSAQASMLAQGALDRALAENCTVALAMVDEVKNLAKGPVASFNAGMAAALCGDQPFAEKIAAALQESYPQGTAVAQYYVPELQAAAEIGVNQPEKALDSLVALRQYDQISLTPYLRGMANAAMGQRRDAIADFQTVLHYRGTAMLLGGDVYPMAELGAARAYRANHDTGDSATAYQRFLMLWTEADRGQVSMTEAMARNK